MPRKLAAGFTDLRRQLACGHQHQRARRARARGRATRLQALQQRQRECQGLAGTGLGRGEQIAAGLDGGNGALLDWGRLGKPKLPHRAQQWRA